MHFIPGLNLHLLPHAHHTPSDNDVRVSNEIKLLNRDLYGFQVVIGIEKCDMPWELVIMECRK